MARRVILRAPVPIVVEHRKALSLDDDQASAHPLTSCCLEEPSELIAVAVAHAGAFSKVTLTS